MNKSWIQRKWNEFWAEVERRWNVFRRKSLLGKGWAVLVTLFLLWLGWTLLKLVWDYVVYPHVVIPIARSLGYNLTA